jgi:pantetheine-phosphate adenylyltransferase
VAHIDILKRALPLFDEVVVGIGLNNTKQGFISNEKKEEMLQLVFQHEPKITVATYEGLTVEYCKQIGAQYMIRGIRSASDFEYEKAISQMNQSMHPDIESVFIISRPGYSAISSTIVRDILRNGGDISQFVPKEIASILLGLK